MSYFEVDVCRTTVWSLLQEGDERRLEELLLSMHISFKLKTKSSSLFFFQCRLWANQFLFCTPTDHWVLKVSSRSVLWILLEAHKINFIAEVCTVCMMCVCIYRHDQNFKTTWNWPEKRYFARWILTWFQVVSICNKKKWEGDKTYFRHTMLKLKQTDQGSRTIPPKKTKNSVRAPCLLFII